MTMTCVLPYRDHYYPYDYIHCLLEFVRCVHTSEYYHETMASTELNLEPQSLNIIFTTLHCHTPVYIQ
jgi:hypothetical protein